MSTAALALPLASLTLGSARMGAIEREASGARSVAIGLIQPNTPAEFPDRVEATRRLRADSLRAEAEGADVVIWPEAGTYPYALARPLSADSSDPRARINVDRTTPTVFGVISFDRGDPYPYNSTAYLTPEGDLREVCVGTGKKNDLQYYLDRPRSVGDGHGQAPMLWAATALLR